MIEKNPLKKSNNGTTEGINETVKKVKEEKENNNKTTETEKETLSKELSFVKLALEEGKKINDKDLKEFIDSLPIEEQIKARQLDIINKRRQKEKNKEKEDKNQSSFSVETEGQEKKRIEEEKRNESIEYPYSVSGFDGDKKENKESGEKIQKELEKSEKLKEKNRKIDEEQKKEEEKENSKGFFKKFFSWGTAKEVGLKMSGTKIFTSIMDRLSVSKKEKDMQQGEVSEYIVSLVDTIKNGDNSEENKLLRLELKNKLREIKQTNPDQYKKAVEVLFKSRHEKEQIKEQVSEKIKDVYAKERTKKTREVIKEGINSSLIWTGALTMGSTAYGTVIARTINNLYFDTTEQFRDDKGDIKGKEFLNSIKNLRKNWQEKSFAGKASDIIRYGGLAYMLYNGYNMQQAGTLDEYKTLLGKLKNGELPYYSSIEKQQENGFQINPEKAELNTEQIRQMDASKPAAFDYSKETTGSVGAKIETENIVQNSVNVEKNTILHTVGKNESLNSVLRDEKFLESIGAKGLSAHETDNLVANLAKRVGSVEGLEEFKNLQEGGTVDLNNLRQLVEKDIEIGGKTFGSLVERADALDASTTAEGVPVSELSENSKITQEILENFREKNSIVIRNFDNEFEQLNGYSSRVDIKMSVETSSGEILDTTYSKDSLKDFINNYQNFVDNLNEKIESGDFSESTIKERDLWVGNVELAKEKLVILQEYEKMSGIFETNFNTGESGVNTSSELGSGGGKIEYNTEFKQSLYNFINEKYPSGYTVQRGDLGTWGIVKERLLKETLHLDQGPNALTEDQIKNLTANIMNKLRLEIRAGNLNTKEWGCDLSNIKIGDTVNMKKLLELAENTKLKIDGQTMNLFERASVYEGHPSSAILDRDWENCGGKPCGERVVRHIAEKPAAVAKTVVHTETYTPRAQENFTKEELGMERGITYTETGRTVVSGVEGEHMGSPRKPIFGSRQEAINYRNNHPGLWRDHKVYKWNGKYGLEPKNGGEGNGAGGGSGNGGGRSASSGSQGGGRSAGHGSL